MNYSYDCVFKDMYVSNLYRCVLAATTGVTNAKLSTAITV